MNTPNQETPTPRFTSTHKRKKRPDGTLSTCYEWLGSFITALLCVIVLFTFVFRVVRVSGPSMMPTLSDKDTLIISDMFYEPTTGDIVVLQVPSYKDGLPLIKRVIATEGQHVKIDFDKWTVTVDGKVLNESYLYFQSQSMDRYDCPEEFTVKEGCVFLMGDNRNNSSDSRNSLIGQVDARYIMGKVIFRLFSTAPFGTDTNPLLTPFTK